jgi:hypothetical protein
MRRLFPLVGVLLAVLSAGVAHAQRDSAGWYRIDSAGTVRVQASSIAINGGFRAAWIRHGENASDTLSNGARASSSMAYIIANCDTRQVAARKTVYYGSAGSVVQSNDFSHDPGGHGTWTDVVPGSRGGTVFNFLCNWTG